MMWNSQLILLSVITDGLIALSYYSIPAALFALARKKQSPVPVRPLAILFGLFILFCGSGHIMDIVSIWRPVYWFKGWWNAGTAATSVITAIVLIPKVAGFLKLPETAARLQRDINVLQEEHGTLRTILDSISDGMLLTSESGRILASNRAAKAILGEAIVNGSGRVGWGTTDGESRIGNVIVEHRTRPVEGMGLVHVLRDVTEKRQSEQLRLRLETVIATMNQGFAIVSGDDERIESNNPAMQEIFGRPLEGTEAAGLFAGSPSEKTATFQAIREAAEQAQFWEGETLCERHDGLSFYTFTRVNLHAGGERKFFSVLQTDITAQKQMQAESERLQAQLLQSQKMESLGVLAGGVAHDFNNILTGIMGNASLILHTPPLSEEARDRLNSVIKASERAADLTRQLLAYAGKGRFVIQRLDVSKMLREISSLVQVSVPRNINLILNLAPTLPVVEADPGQLQQLLMNLVINAAEAIGDKPGMVQVLTKALRVDEADIGPQTGGPQMPMGEYVCIEVSDNGCGMNEETRSQIFDPFFTTKFTGRGLGLAAALGIVRSHGGRLQVESAPEEGSTFRVFLPARPGEVAKPATPSPVSELQGSGTVLFVDDEEMVRRTAFYSLQHFGYEVLQAENGRQAVDLFSKMTSRVALVILDMTMPVMGGAEALMEIRKISRSVPVVLTSGFDQPEAMRKFNGQSLAGFLQKPFTAKALAEIVKKAMDR